jgi:endonuclease III related protein
VRDREILLRAHDLLLDHYDIDRWHWRDETPALDICLGSIFVQHTAWTNVEKALQNLREAGAFSIDSLSAIPEPDLALLIRPAGTPAVKARRLKAFIDLVLSHGRLEDLFRLPHERLRALLLATHGIGPETADVICLYAAKQPVVVHDAYTARLCRRLGTGPDGDGYETWRAWLDGVLPARLDYRARNHAAIVVHCKETCRVRPRCVVCPLTPICAFYHASNEESTAIRSAVTPET